jgi:hypothetical protein
MKAVPLLFAASFATLEAASPAPITDESMVPPYQLRDPLVCNDGTPVRSADTWHNKRRPELLQLFASEMYGRTLLGRPEKMRFVVREELPEARAGAVTRLRIGILFDGTEEGPQMELLVYLPNHVTGKVPVFLGLNFDGNYTTTVEPDLPVPNHWAMGLFGNKMENHRPKESGRGVHQHMWPYTYLLEHGYGVATVAYGEIEPDEKREPASAALPSSPRTLAPAVSPADWGTIGTWAWGLSRALDYLETHPRVDPKKVAVLGFSRLGKTALWAGAQDERFALVISNASGAGGAALNKRIFGETVRHLTSHFPYWFAPNFNKYTDNESELPFDQHELLALIAPRPLLVTSGTTDIGADPKGEFLSVLHASPVYQLLGSPGFPSSEMPPPSVFVPGRISYFLRPGSHDVTLEDWQAMVRFADLHFSPKTGVGPKKRP